MVDLVTCHYADFEAQSSLTIQSSTIYRFMAEDVDFITRMPQLRELWFWCCNSAESWIREALKSLPKLVSLTVIWGGYNMHAGRVSHQLMEVDYHTLAKCRPSAQLGTPIHLIRIGSTYLAIFLSSTSVSRPVNYRVVMSVQSPLTLLMYRMLLCHIQGPLTLCHASSTFCQPP